MLTADLIRYRITDDEVIPRYITRRQASTYLKICERMLRLFQNHIGKSKREINFALEALEGKRTDYKIFRGLAKLIEEKGEFAPIKNLDYPMMRHQIFGLAQAHYPIVFKSDLLHRSDRQAVISEIAQKIGLLPEEINTILYGDLSENQILVSFDRDFTPESLLRRYNLALAQGLFYHARRMIVHLSGDYRTVFQYIKLCRLIHWIRPRSPAGYEITLDGPASLQINTQRYGIRMANFLPGLILSAKWTMTADIETPFGIKQFRLNSDCGLSTHYTPASPFDSRIEENFFNKFSRKTRDWKIEREGDLINLGDSVFIPDFTFHHSDGRTVFLEIVGYWTKEYLKKKMEKIGRTDQKNLILAVNSQLNCSRDDFCGEAIFYRTGIRICDVIERLNHKFEAESNGG